MANDLLQNPSIEVRDQLLSQRTEDGHWVGQLSASALSTATAISTFSFYLESKPENSNAVDLDQMRDQVDGGIAWLMTQQNEDGGWGDTPKNYSNISTTMLGIAALHAAGKANDFSNEVTQAERYVESQGGISGLRKRYGRDKTFAVPILANCAMAGSFHGVRFRHCHSKRLSCRSVFIT